MLWIIALLLLFMQYLFYFIFPPGTFSHLHLPSKTGMCYFIGNFFLTRSVLLFPYTSQKIANRPRNTHSCCNSKSKKKGIPPIFQCLNCIAFHNTTHTIIKSTSGNQRDYGSNKKRCRCFFTDSCKNFRIHICNKASQQSRKKHITPEFFSQKEHQPAKKAANCCQRQIFLFYVKKNSKSYRADGSGNQLYNGCCDQSPSLPNKIIAPINPSASAAARSKAAIRRMIPESVSPISISRIAFVDINPGIKSIISPIIILSI